MSLLLIDSDESRGIASILALRELGWRGRYTATVANAVKLLPVVRPKAVVLAWPASMSPEEMGVAVRVLVTQPQQIRPDVVIVCGGPKEYAEVLMRDYADCMVLPSDDAKEVGKLLDAEAGKRG